MSPAESTGPIPAGAILFHIGPFKTGTTALQSVAARRRQKLLDNGVRYPGRGVNHRFEVNSFSQVSSGWLDRHGNRALASPPIGVWRRLKAEIDAEAERRVWFGHENVGMSDDATARRWVDELGERAHVVITLRPFSLMLPSLWQETLKRNAGRGTQDSWLRDFQKLGTAEPMLHDPEALVRRWVAAAGSDRVIVVVADSRHHSFLFHAFEQLLDLPEDLLAAGAPNASRNRALTAAEAELLRRLNRKTRANGLEWRNHEWLVYYGAISRMQSRDPGPTEARLRLPEWALGPALEHDRRVRDFVMSSGVRVLGDPDNLLAAAPKGEVADAPVRTVPAEAAVEALVGAIAVAGGRDAYFTAKHWPARRKLSCDLRINLPAGRAVGKAER